MVFVIADDEPGLPPALADKPARGAVCAYVCTGTVCGEPIGEFKELAAALRQSGA
jgi:uncharacterized protein YyaL (SSP411 family)